MILFNTNVYCLKIELIQVKTMINTLQNTLKRLKTWIKKALQLNMISVECNLYSFESGHEDSVKEHLMEHVNPQREDETVEESDYEGMIKEQLIAFHIVP